jgi:hypothetical protein
VASTRSPVWVRVEAMVSTTTSWLVSGRPRQFMVMWENSRCSIWGEIRRELGVRQRARAKPWLKGSSAVAYPAAASWTV